MNTVLKNDLELLIKDSSINWKKIDGHTFLITGSTGLVGSLIVRLFIQRNITRKANINMVLIVRNVEKAQSMFGNLNIKYIETSVENYTPFVQQMDYIIHAASPTRSRYLVSNPVETLNTQIMGTKNILEQAKISNVKSVVYISSMEMYGSLTERNVTEKDLGYINPLNVRSSYSEGKRICELYCYSYYKEYNVPVKIVRLAQTFGPGILPNENRVFKYFVDCITSNKDIVLKSSGQTIVNYSYTLDTLSGILTILLKGLNGEAYNLVGEKTNMTILDSAKWLIEKYGNGKNHVMFVSENESDGYAPENHMVLNNDKICSLGWKPKYDLKHGYTKLIEYINKENEQERTNNN